ncbi:hypothetical protein IAE29_23605 [Ochrobactrum sp. S46]|nr:hypothetical protein [Ochrobactrum sp. S45]MBK0046306.1 hypothetical protein [Ochrobactrum sp. S46]
MTCEIMTSPMLSRRIYGRRAALTGILIAATTILLIIQAQKGIGMTLPVLVIGIAFAGLFTRPVAEALAHCLQNRIFTTRRSRGAISILIFLLSPLLAPIALVFSTVQFLKSAT